MKVSGKVSLQAREVTENLAASCPLEGVRVAEVVAKLMIVREL